MAERNIFYGDMTSPVGPLTALSDGDVLIRVDYGTMKELKDKYIKWA